MTATPDPVLALLARGKERIAAPERWCKGALWRGRAHCARGGLAGRGYESRRVRGELTYEERAFYSAADQLLHRAARMVGTPHVTDDYGLGASHIAFNNAPETEHRHVLGLYDWAMWLRRRELGLV